MNIDTDKIDEAVLALLYLTRGPEGPEGQFILVLDSKAVAAKNA
jgi:hypothetical protein